MRELTDAEPVLNHGYVFAMFSSILGHFDAQSTGYDLNMQGKIETLALTGRNEVCPDV